MSRNNVAVVTAVTKNYDHNLKFNVHNADCWFFRDEQTTPRQGWIQHSLEKYDWHPRRIAKLPKINPHRYDFLKNDYEYVIWIDGDMEVINRNFVDEILGFMDDSGLVISPHFDPRHCAYGEATIRPPKYASEPLDEQVAFYRQEGFPEDFGLYEGGVAARRMNAPGLEELEQVWLQQNIDYSYQDQVSLPYALWKTGFKPSVLPRSFRDYKWVRINAHTSER